MRQLKQIINAQPSQDGDGVKIHRLAGRHLHQVLNPFLMVDEINTENATDYIGGFPEHPHRGFETITYMKAGRMRHRDHMGNEGLISAGDVQWMTAGAGVLHSEMPEQEQGLLHGFQIWLNLPAAEKMKPAAYREITRSAIANKALSSGGSVNVIAGTIIISEGDSAEATLTGPMPDMSTEAVLADVNLAPNESIELAFNANNPAWVYVFNGATDQIQSRQLGVYQNGPTLTLKASDKGAELLLLSGKPINEPIVQYGPFVMNTAEEIETALSQFQSSAFITQLKAGGISKN
jgi:hypothetical protein